MNNIIITTVDGKKISIEYNKVTYEYSIESPSIDTSSLIKVLADSGVVEEIKIDDQLIINYMNENEVSDEFKELYKFLKNIPKEYNKAVNQMLNLE